MTRILNGSHWPNQRVWNIEQCLRAAPGCVTVLHQQLVNDSLLGGRTADDENCNTFGKLRYGFPLQGIPAAPERFIHVRCYHPNSLSLDPRAYAEHMVNLLANWKGSRDQAGMTANLWLDPLVGVSSANESNLHYENGQPDAGKQADFQTVAHYQRIAAWDMAFWQRIDELVPGRRALRVSPAFADGHEPPGYPADGEYTIPDVRAMLEASDLVGIHPYALLHTNVQSGVTGKDRYWYMARPFRPVGWEGPHDIGGVISQYPHKLFLVTETGTFTHSDRARTDETWRELDAFYWLCAKSGKVVGVTPFIWNSDAAHPQNIIWPNPELRTKLENAPRYVTTADIPTRGARPIPPVERPFEPNPNGYSVGAGFVAEATRRRTPLLSDEIYLNGPRGALSLAVTGDGLLVWTQAGGVKFAAFE